MIKVKELEKYCKKMLFDFNIEGNLLYIGDLVFNIVDDELTIFDEEFDFLPIFDNEYDFVYEFCGHWFIQYFGKGVSMTPLKQIGKCNQKIPTPSFIGIHSGNELLNAVGLYDDWVSKAKYLGIKKLGICEKNSIGGSMDFQKSCTSNGIKPIIGMSFEVKGSDENFFVKCYCKGFLGWQNLLKISYKLNVDNDSTIDEDFLNKNKEDIYIIIDTKGSSFRDYSNLTDLYQLDTTIFEDEDRDSWYVDNLERFIKSKMNPILLNDAYYLEDNEWEVREKLNIIAKSFDFKSRNQYFKNNDQIAIELSRMFEKGNSSWVKLFKVSKENLENLCNNCNFEYDTTSRHLPKYEMTDEESSKFDSNEKLFLHLIKLGFSERGVKKNVQQKYIDRLKKEIGVLKKGQVIDYFLITRDILNFAKSKDILVGIGRGSAGGSLVSYLLGIIQINPMEFDLIFERFLNEGRMGGVVECDAYFIKFGSNEITLNERSIVKVDRDGLLKNIYVEDMLVGDKLIDYEK